MPRHLEYYSLDSDADWDVLKQDVYKSDSLAVRKTAEYLKAIGVKSALIEPRYTDKDYSSEFKSFYSTTFKRFTKECQRLHFFNVDVRATSEIQDWLEYSAGLEALRKHYVGFSVVTPLSHAPIGRTVIQPTFELPGAAIEISIRSTFRTNVVGQKFSVIGAPFIQQDGRIGACAQAAIWMACRHMHSRHDYGWHSIADITQHALTPTDYRINFQLPAGSESLSFDAMVRACRAMGFQPLCYQRKENDTRSLFDRVTWYLDSGLPVILGLASIGHAVTAVGSVYKPTGARPKPGSYHRWDVFNRGLVVHDDQGGPYQILPATAKDSLDPIFAEAPLMYRDGRTTALNVDDDVRFVLVPLPQRVYCKPEVAEDLAFDITLELCALAERFRDEGEAVNPDILAFWDEYQKGEAVFRTYLTSAAGYREHLAKINGCNGLKNNLMLLHLPHFIWVTEIGTLTSLSNPSPASRRIFGHMVSDATGNPRDPEARLVSHMPGFLVVKDVTVDGSPKPEKLTILTDDVTYEPRHKYLED